MEQIENLVLPHGWNDLEEKPMEGIAKGLKDNDDMYFVHSYTFRTYNANNILAINMEKNSPPLLARKLLRGTISSRKPKSRTSTAKEFP